MMTRSELNQKIMDFMTSRLAEGVGHPATEADLKRMATWEAVVEVLVQAELVKEDDKPLVKQGIFL